MEFLGICKFSLIKTSYYFKMKYYIPSTLYVLSHSIHTQNCLRWCHYILHVETPRKRE